MTTSTVTNAEALDLLADLRLGVELNRHCAPDVEKRLASLDRAIALLQAESTKPAAPFDQAGIVVGTVTRRDSGNEVAEHEIVLDRAFEDSLYAHPCGTEIKLYATPSADVALGHVRSAAVALGAHPHPEGWQWVG